MAYNVPIGCSALLLRQVRLFARFLRDEPLVIVFLHRQIQTNEPVIHRTNFLLRKTSLQIKAAEEAIDKAIAHADKLLISSQNQEPSILNEMIAANAELEEASSLLRKLEEKDENLRSTKRVDRNAPPDVIEAEISLIKTDQERKVEVAERGTTNLKIAAALERKMNCTAKLRTLHESKAELQGTLTRLYMLRIHTNTADSKKFSSLPSIAKSLRVRSLVQLQCVISGCVESKDLQGMFAVLIRDLTTAAPAISSPVPNSHSSQSSAEVHPISEGLRAETLLDVSRVACQMGLSEQSVQSFEAALKINCPASSMLRVKMDLSRALHVVVESDSGVCRRNFTVPFLCDPSQFPTLPLPYIVIFDIEIATCLSFSLSTLLCVEIVLTSNDDPHFSLSLFNSCDLTCPQRMRITYSSTG